MYQEDFGNAPLTITDRFIDYDGERYPIDQLRSVSRESHRSPRYVFPIGAGLAGALLFLIFVFTGKWDYLIHVLVFTPPVVLVLLFFPRKTEHLVRIHLSSRTLTFSAPSANELDALYAALLGARGMGPEIA